MEKRFLDKVEDNATVQTWSETTQQKKCDSLAEGYVSESWDFTRISVTQNSLQELKEIWDQWDDKVNQLFYSSYRDLCFTFRGVDLMPTVEEYMALLRCSKIQVDKAYSRAVNVPTFLKKLLNIIRMTHPDTKKKVDVFALSVYGLVVFPKALGHIDEAVTDLFDRLNKGVTPVPTILAETFRSLNEYRKVEIVAIQRQEDIIEEKYMAMLQNLQEEDIEWRAHWMLPDETLYRCGYFDW
ncbi:hypothetical protein Goshw_019662, partial [Gossypium schwendimanii]|nr:hypothetical protein [Gossypium schwendimanii]